MTVALIELENIEKTYFVGKERIDALKGIDLSVNSGDFLAVLGSSGSGKSTLLNILGCLDRATNGEYYFEGENTRNLSERRLARLRGRKIGFIFQSFNLLPELTACENITAAMRYIGLQGNRAIACEALDKVGLLNRRDHLPSQLSGGQQQRVAIARVIAQNPKLILADEPTGNLDSRNSEEIIKILLSLNREGRTVILITHDENIAARIPKKLHIKDGRIL